MDLNNNCPKTLTKVCWVITKHTGILLQFGHASRRTSGGQRLRPQCVHHEPDPGQRQDHLVAVQQELPSEIPGVSIYKVLRDRTENKTVHLCKKTVVLKPILAY